MACEWQRFCLLDHGVTRDQCGCRFDSSKTFYIASEKETLEVVVSILAKHFYTTPETETLEFVGSILASPFKHFDSG